MIIKNADLKNLKDGDRFHFIEDKCVGVKRIINNKHYIEQKETLEEITDESHDIVLLDNESTYYNTVGNIIEKADLLKLNDDTVFEIIGQDNVVGTVNIVNGIHQVDIGGEILEITEEFNKNVDIKILSIKQEGDKCKRMAFV